MKCTTTLRPPRLSATATILVAGFVLGFLPLSIVHRAAADEPAHAQANGAETGDKSAPGPETQTSLDDAIADVNQRLANDLARLLADSDDPQRLKAAMKPLSVDDVIAAIRHWDREEFPVEDATYRIYENIADTQMLPPRYSFEVRDQWYRLGDDDCRLSRIMLDVMTGENQGYAFAIRDAQLDRRKYCPLPAGYQWLRRYTGRGPRGEFRGWSNSDIKVSFGESAADLVVTVKHSFNVLGVDVIAFDAQGKWYRLVREPAGVYSGFLVDRFRLDPDTLPLEKVQDVGIQGVTQNDIQRIARIAARRADQQGIRALPLPEVNQPYDFSLTAGGQPFDSQQLRGKVVLVDLWGSWCVPCLKQMPKLKEIYARWHDQGLEVVGISFDDELERAQAVLDRLEIPWKSVNMARLGSAQTLEGRGTRHPPAHGTAHRPPRRAPLRIIEPRRDRRESRKTNGRAQ